MPDPASNRTASKTALSAAAAPATILSRWESLEGLSLFSMALVLMGIAVGSIFSGGIRAPFIFDDSVSIRENPSIEKLWPLVGNAEHPGPLNPPEDLPTSGRPLVNFSLALNYHFGGFDCTGYHLFNLAVHVLSALLLMAIVRRTLSLEFFGARFARAKNSLGFAAALLWALHPLQTETVLYVTQRTELLVGFCYLATLYGSLRYWTVPSRAGRSSWLLVATLACLAGMACKEVMVTAPVVVLLFDRTFVAGSFAKALRKSWPLYVGLSLGWILLAALEVGNPRSLSAGFHLGVPPDVWWFTQMKVLCMYLKLAIWPHPLAIHYEMRYLTTLNAAWPWLFAATGVIIGTLILLWRRNPVGFAGAWVLLILSPTFVVPIITEVAADRRMYLPLAALVVLVVIGAYSLCARATPAVRAVTVAILIVWACVLFTFSWNQARLYADPIALYRAALEHFDSDTVHTNLGVALSDAGQSQEAIDQYKAALRLKPDNFQASNDLGVEYAKLGKTADAIQQYQQALRINARYFVALDNLGNALLQADRAAEAIEQYERALKLQPDSAEVHYNLAKAMKQAGRTAEAIDQYELAIKLKPEYAEAYLNLGVALKQSGRIPEAIDRYQQAIRLKPDFPEALVNLATAYAMTNRIDEATQTAQKALELARSQGKMALVEQIEGWLKDSRGRQSTPQ